MRKVAVVGDLFMKPEVFADALRSAAGGELDIRTRELPWPDEPMRHGEPGGPLAGLRERATHALGSRP